MSSEASDPEHARQLVDRALALFGDARESFLDESCQSDPSLRAELDALLAEIDEAPTPPELTPGRHKLLELGPDQQVGPYRLLELLGEGGFGSVFLAEQREPVRRRVALKVVKLGMDTRQVIARFEAERQALSMMSHSNIARVLDVGATDAGRPYFVMELVRGVPITEYCETHGLALAERLELFGTVCMALQHAHQKGVIHRDVKPSNVLVSLESGRPVAKVIDFGIAKAIHQELTDKTLVTLQQQLIGTPAYMSPEQAEQTGLDVDTRSDIYALGVLLYELLTGATPFDRRALSAAGHTEMLRIIREQEPQRPSTRVLSAEDERAARRRPPEPDLARRLSGDLDWIVVKCLEKDRTRRYETASELAAEVRRHLTDEPVLAGPPSATYRLRKFVRRNRAGVLTAGAGLALLLVAVVGTTWGLLWALEERARADGLVESERQATLAATASASAASREARRASLEAERAEASAARALTATLDAEREALAAKRAEALSQQRAADLERVVGLHEAQLQGVDGELLGLSLRDQLLAMARQQAERDGLPPQDALHAVTRLERQLTGINFTDLSFGMVIEGVLDPTLQAVQTELADQPLVRARMQQGIAKALVAMDRHEHAEAPQRAALDTFRAELGEHDRVTLEAQRRYGDIVAGQGRLDEGLEILEACLAAQQRDLAPEHRDGLVTMVAMASVLEQRGLLQESREHYERALAAQRRQFGADDLDTLRTMSQLSQTLYLLREFALSADTCGEALRGFRALPGEHRQEIWTATNTLSVALRAQGQLGAARELQQDLHLSARRLLGDRHRITLMAALNQGGLLRQMRAFGEAEAYLEPVLATNTMLHGEGHPYTLEARLQLGLLRFDQGRYEESDRLIESAWRGMCRARGEEHHNAFDIAIVLAENRVIEQRLFDAEPLLVENAHTALRQRGLDDWRTERALDCINSLLTKLDQRARTLSGAPDETVACLNAAAGARNVLGDFDVSEALLGLAVALHEQAEDQIPTWRLAESRSLLGEAYAGQRRWDAAQDLLLDSFRQLESQPPSAANQQRLSRSARRLVRFYEDSESPAAANSWRQRVRELDGLDG